MSSFVFALSRFTIYLSNLLEYLSHVVCSILLLILCQWNTYYADSVAMFVTFRGTVVVTVLLCWLLEHVGGK